MALTLYATTGGTTTQLNNGAPFKFESAEGFAGADVVRHEQRGPFQHGNTDLGFRIAPRIVTLNLLFYATTAALLDTYRQALMAAFKPLDSTATTLYAQRDDGEIRTLTVFTVGDIDIALVPEQYPGHLHRATLQLRAANPLWKASSDTVGTADFSGLTSWWLAGGAIAAGNVKNHFTYPAQAPVNAFLGTITGDWSVAIVTAKDTANPGVAAWAWADSLSGSASFMRNTSGVFLITDSGLGGGTAAWPGTTGYNYHVVESRSGTQVWRYWTAGSITQYINTTDGTATYDFTLHGEGASWRWREDRTGPSNVWTPEIRKAAILGTVTVNQLQALGPYMLDTLTGTVTVVNDGDTYAYPLIIVHGPVADPVIVNTTTAGTLNLAGITLGSAEIMTIDLRGGDKQITNQSGSSLLGSATTTPMGMASFALAPHPIAAGGTNTFVLTPGSVGAAAYFSVQFASQYMSW